MITLSLTETQRLNLEAFCDNQSGTVGQLRQWIKVANIIAIPPDRKEAIGLRPIPGGFLWDKVNDTDLVECALEDSQADMLYKGLSEFSWPPGQARSILTWLDPVLQQLKP